MAEDYNLDEIKGFVKTHCDPEASFEMKAKEAAWALLQELNNRKDCECSCSKEKESDEEAGIVAEKDEKSIEDTNAEVTEKLGGEQKFKKLQNTKQGNSSYFEFAKQQMQAIGAAGVIAMSAGVATQAETIKTESAVIVTHVRHEVPAIDKFLVSMEQAVNSMMSRIPFLPNNSASMGGSTGSLSPKGSNGSAQASATAAAATEATKSEESAAETAEAITEESKTEETAKTEEAATTESVAEEASATETTKEETASTEEATKSAEAPEMEIPQPVIVPHTTEVNPPINNNERNNSKTNRSNTR
jgi:hypothetical protein